MRVLAVLLSASLPLNALAQVPASTSPASSQAPAASTAAVEISTESFPGITVTAPRLNEQEALQVRDLKLARAGGATIAAGGVALTTYIAIFAGGPIAWAAGLLFVGGLTVYISHRRLHGRNDLAPEPSRAPPEPAVRP
jgi:hypothetical protein